MRGRPRLAGVRARAPAPTAAPPLTAGVYTWPDGRRYEGDFDDGFRHGFGETDGGGGGGGQMV